jgi:hypothetical protein
MIVTGVFANEHQGIGVVACDLVPPATGPVQSNFSPVGSFLRIDEVVNIPTGETIMGP